MPVDKPFFNSPQYNELKNCNILKIENAEIFLKTAEYLEELT